MRQRAQRQGRRRLPCADADGAAVIQWPDTGASNQQWAFQSTGDGCHAIACVRSGKVLDVKGGSTADGVALTQYCDVGSSNQRTFHRVTG
ncbi:RICIN domain-containing protein [Streptomyces sp. NPDC008086]|uniref:RICIN domain-containing protein n=1 Tax=unclassified Streptomyces TaxID=2593676 RepID=UPI0036916DC6